RVRAADLLAVRSTEQLVGGQPERLAHHVPEREVDAGLRDEVARKRVVQLLVDALDVEGILADDLRREVPIDVELGALGGLGMDDAATYLEGVLADAGRN